MRQIMKCLIIAIIFISCEKNENKDSAVEFIEKVKTETFTDVFLPDLEPNDISTLLNYRDDKTILSKYPTNPVSSYGHDTVTVGIIALWAIESIRISELNGDSSEYNRFPSLNPILKDTTDLMTNKFELQDHSSNLYFNWWNQDGIDVNEKLNTNPLNGSTVIWK